MHNSKRAIVSAQFSPKCTIRNAQLNRGKYPLRPSDNIPSLQYWLPLIAREWVTNCSHPWYFAIGRKQIQPNICHLAIILCFDRFFGRGKNQVKRLQDISRHFPVWASLAVHSYLRWPLNFLESEPLEGIR